MLVDLSERKHVQQEHLHRALIPFDIEDLGKPQKNEAKTESVASGMVLSPLAAESLFRWSALVDRKNEKRNNNHVGRGTGASIASSFSFHSFQHKWISKGECDEFCSECCPSNSGIMCTLFSVCPTFTLIARVVGVVSS